MKERIEILSGGHSWVLEDYRRLIQDGQEIASSRKQNKGHQASVAHFRSALAGNEPVTCELLASARVALLAAKSIGGECRSGR